MSKHPVPKKIKLFSVIIAAVMTISLYSFPKAVTAGVAYERGLRAVKGKKYVTAEREFEKAAKIFPNSFIINGRLYLAYVKNHKFDLAEEIFLKFEGKESSKQDEGKIIDEINSILEYLEDSYMLNEELASIMDLYDGYSTDDLAGMLKDYAGSNPDDPWGHYYYGSVLFDVGRYGEARDACLMASSLKPDVYELRLAAAAALRQTGEFDKAVAECNAVLAENAEYADAYASLSKIKLKQRRYAEALELASKAYSLDSWDYDAVDALALAYHFNGMAEERDELLEILEYADPAYYEYVKDIIDGKSDLFE